MDVLLRLEQGRSETCLTDLNVSSRPFEQDIAADERMVADVRPSGKLEDGLILALTTEIVK